MFKVKNCLLPVSCMDIVTITNTNRTYETRKMSYFKISGCRTGIRENNVSIRGPKLWELLEWRIQNASSLFIFKKCFVASCIKSYAQCQI